MLQTIFWAIFFWQLCGQFCQRFVGVLDSKNKKVWTFSNILLLKQATFCCLFFPMYFQCIFSTQEMLVVNGCIKCNETTALNTSFTCKFGYFLLQFNRKSKKQPNLQLKFCIQSSSFIVLYTSIDYQHLLSAKSALVSLHNQFIYLQCTNAYCQYSELQEGTGNEALCNYLEKKSCH